MSTTCYAANHLHAPSVSRRPEWRLADRGDVPMESIEIAEKKLKPIAEKLREVNSSTPKTEERREWRKFVSGKGIYQKPEVENRAD